MQHNHRLEFLRKNVLNKRISSSKKTHQPIELIVKADSRRKGWLSSELDKVGKVTRIFKSIPYLSFNCDPSDAYKLNQTFNKLADHSAYRSLAAAISVIDLSNTFSIPTLTKSRIRTSNLWNLEKIGAYAAQQVASGGGVKIAVMDTGVDYNHSELRSNFGGGKGYDFVRNSDDPMDFNGHGTHVAGIAFGNNYGVATSAQAYSVRVLDEDGSGSEADTIAGLDWVAKQDIDIVNMSFGSRYASTALEEMCYYLANKGVLLVAAAGNSGFGASYPAAFGDPVIAVAAVDEENKHPEFSNIFETNDISAPGVRITSSYIGGYATLSGTSMSAPHVSGGLALVMSALKQNQNLEELMESTAETLGEGIFPERNVYGAGLIRLDRMVESKSEMRIAIPLRAYGREVLSAIKEVVWT